MYYITVTSDTQRVTNNRLVAMKFYLPYSFFPRKKHTCLIFSRKWWIQKSCYCVPKFSYVILRKSTIRWFKLLITNSVENSPMIFPSQWHGVVCMLMFRLSKNKQNILTFKHNSLRDALKMNKVWDNFFSELEKTTQSKQLFCQPFMNKFLAHLCK